MEAITEVTTVENGQVTIKIPPTFPAKLVRVFVVPEEPVNEKNTRVSELFGSLPDLDLQGWQKHMEEIRNEWER
jgi:hypothetical protein